MVWLKLLSCAAIILGLKLAQNSLFFSKRSLPLPPGPKPSWFGFKVKLPSTYPWRTYSEWKDTYGDLIYIQVFGNPILVLNSPQAISDLFEKRSANYSSRPIRTMVVELIGWNWLFSAMPYGNSWKRHRNLFLKYFPMASSHEHHRSLQTEEVHTLLRNLLHDPAKFRHHVRRTAAAIILKLTYGIQIDEHVDEEGDNYVSLADKAMSSLSQAGIFGTYFVDYVPILKHLPSWLPFASFQKQALKWRVSVDGMANLPFNMVKRKTAEGNAPSSIVGEELEDIASGRTTEADEFLIRNVAATTYAAGSDTTVSSIVSLFLAVCLNDDVQRKAQKELDRLNRLPVFSDRDQLPYIDCICYELLRWNPVTPLGLARVVPEDDEYMGYSIPKGTTVLPNVWAILHDPNVYPDPLKFDPDRFLNPEENAAKGINEIPDAAFGFGRRMCPGRWFAYDTIWIAVASILSVYDISKPLNQLGQPIDIEPRYESHHLSHPCPFDCQIKPRSPEAVAEILQTAEESFEL
ncbi:hypothetical protein GYMLUDRAFT_33229 [Collybiopsis luxurians FD-317 M1]|nr:hypothetical protein GYMLUDRAFT_33229 [Collybiopsis luxurians FD-317 M1]